MSWYGTVYENGFSWNMGLRLKAISHQALSLFLCDLSKLEEDLE